MKLSYTGDQIVEKMNYVEYMGKKKILYRMYMGNLKNRDNLEELGIREDNIKNICMYLKEAA